MGCGVSLSPFSFGKRITFGYSMNEGKGCASDDNLVNMGRHDFRDNRNGEHDVIAVAVSSPKAVALVDYRGRQVYMANATTSKLHAICRWADNVLEIKETNGGWVVDPQSGSSALTRWDNVDSDSSCMMRFSDSVQTNTNRNDVCMQSLPGQGSVRNYDRSMTSRVLERYCSPSRATNLSQF